VAREGTETGHGEQSPRWTEETWRAVEEKLDVAEPDAGLRHAINEPVVSYLAVARAHPRAIPRASTVRDTLATITRAAENLAGALAEPAVRFSREWEEWQAVRSRLHEAASAWRPDEGAQQPPHLVRMVELAARTRPATEFEAPLGPGNPNRFFVRLDELLERLPAIAKAAHERAAARVPFARSGPKPDDSLPFLVARLATIYRQRTGKAAEEGIAHQRQPEGYDGSFVAFVEYVVQALPGTPVAKRTELSRGRELYELFHDARHRHRVRWHPRCTACQTTLASWETMEGADAGRCSAGGRHQPARDPTDGEYGVEAG
jgi:hypothetical protein